MCHQAMQEITNADLGANEKVAILRLVNHAVMVTAYGQVHDMFNEATGRVGVSDVENTHIWKTAYYTFIAPLQSGAIAAGAPEPTLECLYDYGKHMGLAFQAADDVLGTFGAQKQSGKSTQDDIREGKITLLAAFMLQRATPEQRQEFASYFGRDLTEKEFAACKKILQTSGAKDFVQTIARQESQKALQALKAAPHAWQPEQVEFLRSLAHYIVQRQA